MAALVPSDPQNIKPLPPSAAPKPTFNPPPSNFPSPSTYFSSPFNPSLHLLPHTPPKTHTLASLSLPSTPISPIAVSNPFHLFTPSAIQQIRSEVLSDEVWSRHRFSSTLAACQLRGMAPGLAKFTYDAWTHPETLKRVSEVAGVDLVPVIDYEIGHVNISVCEEGEKDNKDNMGCKKAVVGWHRDSYPFVCVLMLSDARGMVGGETGVRTGTGEVLKVRGPDMGSAVVLQGRYVEHVALPGYGCLERITMVTSFRPKDPELVDDSQLLTVRPVSDLDEIYYQWTEYRLELMEERCRRLVRMIRKRKKVGRKFDVVGLKDNLEEMVRYMEKTSEELVDVEFYKIPEKEGESGSKEEKEEKGPVSKEGARKRKRGRS